MEAPTVNNAAPTRKRSLWDDPGTWAGLAMIAAGVTAACWLEKRDRQTTRNPGKRRENRGPTHSDPDVQKALDFRRDFHWGIPARGIKTMRFSADPKVGVQLGQVAEITYKTNKRGEKAKFFTHDFEGPLPKLVMDVKTKRLHLVGGGYTVTADGITG